MAFAFGLGHALPVSPLGAQPPFLRGGADCFGVPYTTSSGVDPTISSCSSDSCSAFAFSGTQLQSRGYPFSKLSKTTDQEIGFNPSATRKFLHT